MNITGNHRFVSNADQDRCKCGLFVSEVPEECPHTTNRCKYCGSYVKRGSRVICTKCGRSNFTYKRAEGTA